MCLTMDRQEARNALSVQMVQVRGGRRPNPAASPTDNQELREGIAKTAATPSYVRHHLFRIPTAILTGVSGTVEEVKADNSARLLLLHTPHAGMFCAGADLRERKSMSPKQVSNFLDSLRSLLFELEGLSIPTIAVVDGFALGGGTELALGCDIRVGGTSLYLSCLRL